MNHQCTNCKKVFTRAYDLHRHIKNKPKTCIPPEEKINVKCEYCNNNFSTNASLKRHKSGYCKVMKLFQDKVDQENTTEKIKNLEEINIKLKNEITLLKEQLGKKDTLISQLVNTITINTSNGCTINELNAKVIDNNRKIGYIYKIFSNNNDKVYVGKTEKKINKRFSEHKSDFKRYLKDKSSLYCSSYEILQYDDAKIELLEEYSFIRKSAFNKRETFWINKLSTINIRKNFS